MTELYPLTFKPVFKEKIWGGTKIRDILGKDFSPLNNCGETWEVSDVEGNVSEVREGPLKGQSLRDIIYAYGEKLLGKRVKERFGNTFPLLIKFIDAADDLSIQVHPDDELAYKRHGSPGKTEMWYVLQADAGAKLISGFSKTISRDTYLYHLNRGSLPEILNYESVQAGDVFFMPAGRVHSIGKGILLAEIQQSSDITYRIYDFGRKDANGEERELHTEEALDAMNFNARDSYKTHYTVQENQPVNLAECPYFSTNHLLLNKSVSRDYTGFDSFVIYMVTEGSLQLSYNDNTMRFNYGDVVLLPAIIQQVTLEPSPECRILEISMGKEL